MQDRHPSSHLYISYAALTACGTVREVNQDVFVTGGLIGTGTVVAHQGVFRLPDRGTCVFAVVDGMGGHHGGEDAAGLVAAELARLHGEPVPSDFSRLCERLSDKVFRAGVGLETPSMGAAMAMLMVTSSHVVSVNVGDCRAYKLAGGYLGQLSVDDRGLDGPTNVLTQSLGGEPRVIDAHELRDPLDDDPARYVLCSDGVHGFVDAAAIKTTLLEMSDPAEAANRLVELAVGTSQDNYTVIVFDVVRHGEPSVR